MSQQSDWTSESPLPQPAARSDVEPGEFSPGLELLPHLALQGSIPREGLLRRLEGLPDDVCVVQLVAPAGYGKTTAARQWAESARHRSGWLQLNSSHSDPSRLALDLALTLRGIGPGGEIGDDPLAALADLPLDAVGRRLAAEVLAGGQPVMLVLDDVHRLRARRSLDLVVALAEQLPPASRVVALANHRPRWQVGRLVAQGRYREFGAADLAFTRAEAAAFLRAAAVHLPTDAVDELLRRTEGWPLGLHLSVRILTEAPDPAVAVWTLTGDSPWIADYFREEVLAGHTVETIRFLMQTAVLNTVSGSLCDVALDTTGSAARLAQVRALGLFLEPEDDRGEWYRYHPLFGETLRAELRRREPGTDLRILQRAARWYEDQDRPVEAIEHAIAGGEALTAARLIVAHAQDLNSRGEILRVRRCLEELDEDTLELYPPLAVMAAWVWALTGAAIQATRALRIAESASFDDPMADGSVSLESAVLRARAAMAPDGVERMLADAERAVALEPPGSRWHTMAALLLGAAHMVNGHRQDAARWFEQSARFGRAEQRPGALTALAERALLAADEGDWSMAELCVQDSVDLREAGGLQDFMPALTSYLAEARVALHGGMAQRAMDNVLSALSLYELPSPVAFPWLAVQAAVALGHVFLDLGDIVAADRKLAEARRHISGLPTVGVLQAWVDRLATAVEFSVTHSMLEETSSLTTAELRVLRLLPTHLSLSEIADELVVSRNTVKSQVAAIYRKLGVENRSEAVTHAEAEGLLRQWRAP
jgi:LuxR family transcriptional regulator, maltose regulon positive regulatory protein